jgi:hypothetical protein
MVTEHCRRFGFISRWALAPVVSLRFSVVVVDLAKGPAVLGSLARSTTCTPREMQGISTGASAHRLTSAMNQYLAETVQANLRRGQPNRIHHKRLRSAESIRPAEFAWLELSKDDFRRHSEARHQRSSESTIAAYLSTSLTCGGLFPKGQGL